jgi:hypothetical protein
MKIIFFSGSAEPGNDGVGDYSRRLCGELVRLGHEAQILSLCDFHTTTYKVQNQVVEKTEVKVNRIPASLSYNDRLKISQDILNDFQPEWISLQFVPYSFNPKGLPFWLPSFLNNLKGNYKWHIMFHELWLGIDKESSFKHKCIGKFQELIIKKIIANLKPKLINTQNDLYRFILENHNIDSAILPICSNIPVKGIENGEKQYIQFVLFGTIHKGAPLKDFVEDLVKNKDKLLKPVKFILIGSNGPELSDLVPVLDKYKIAYDVLGRQSENVISQVLIDSDFGISTTPFFQTEKSGIYAAYKEHHLNSICVSRKWTPTKKFNSTCPIIKYEKSKLNLTPGDAEIKVYDLNFIANQFINSISKI